MDIKLQEQARQKRLEKAEAEAAEAEAAVARHNRPRRRQAAVGAQKGCEELLNTATRTLGGEDWAERGLPVLEAALEALTGNPEGAARREHSLDKLSPSEAFLAVRSLVTKRRASDPPCAH